MDNRNYKHRLAALLSADVAGYSGLMAADEVGTIRTLTAYRAEMTALVGSRGGRVVNFVGDNMLAEFTSTLDAVKAALNITVSDQRFRDVQLQIKARNRWGTQARAGRQSCP
jgi:adenylate cyclase